MKSNENFFTLLCRWTLGLVFILSGFVKAVDPFGFALKISEYLTAFGLDWLTPASKAFAVAGSSIELFLGLMLLFGIGRRMVSLASFVLMCGFTVFTLVSALTDPVSDCGCFGDAVKLSPWESFLKNVVLLLVSVPVWSSNRARKRDAAPEGPRAALFAALFIALPLFVNIYSSCHLPMIDFLPFKEGADIGQLTGYSGEKSHTTLIYKELATGQQREFEITDTTWRDTTRWVYVDTRVTSAPAQSGAAEGMSFVLFSGEDDYTSEVLSGNEYTLMLTMLDPAGVTGKERAAMAGLRDYAFAGDYPVIVATAAELDGDLIEGVPSYNIDGTTLKSMVRANAGLVLLHRGVVVKKWSARDIPHWSSGNVLANTVAADRVQKTKYLAAASAGLLLLLLIVYKRRRVSR